MRKILVPIDLSDSSKNAINIAQKLAHEYTEILILNVVSAPSEAFFKEDGTVKEGKEIDLSSLKRQVVEIESTINDNYSYIENKSVVVKIGDINSVIMHEVKTNSYDLLVLGMTGQLANNFWTNSHTEFLSKHSNIPVLTLKCDRVNMSLDKILFVSDFLHGEAINLSVFKKIAEKFNSKIILLMVLTKDQQRTEDDIIKKANEFAVSNEINNFEIELIHSKNVEEGIATYTEEKKIDLIGIGTEQRGGFSTLFRKSISQDLVKKLYHPIITIPIDQE